jgi:hypothetical protein
MKCSAVGVSQVVDFLGEILLDGVFGSGFLGDRFAGDSLALFLL